MYIHHHWQELTTRAPNISLGLAMQLSIIDHHCLSLTIFNHGEWACLSINKYPVLLMYIQTKWTILADFPVTFQQNEHPNNDQRSQIWRCVFFRVRLKGGSRFPAPIIFGMGGVPIHLTMANCWEGTTVLLKHPPRRPRFTRHDQAMIASISVIVMTLYVIGGIASRIGNVNKTDSLV